MNNFRGALIAIATLSLSQPLLADVKLGVDAWQQGDYAKALAEWRPLAEAGDADAQFNMGQAYKLGRGVSTDLNAAIQWYRKAAAQGHLRAEDNLGLCLFQQGDRSAAMPYLERAAARGDSRAQYIYGTALFNGDLVGKDWVRAYALMTRASASGLTQANSSLQQMNKYISDEQREQGKALAARMEREKGSLLASAPARNESAGPALRPAPAPIRTTEVAPSAPPARAEPPKVKTPTPPKPAPVAATPPARSASGPWRVQLGAFSADARARAMWTQLAGKVRGLSSYQPYYVQAGGITRLQAGPLDSSADATRLCAQIKSAGADCIPKRN
ncbi:SPOR domain-containing protein [Sphingobium cloacae]|uniref:Sel1 domain protein repeat-containing protein n=1 Tax=Sphingobium cloacae TaxID=120107 RepID=A0A1E1F019_9SPHN|nr:SPOR domain-containing protein [Sphingobium cloacae]BAV63853.1 Sel1 domain protein repeat-containing protein [Sphingobium cloacae]